LIICTLARFVNNTVREPPSLKMARIRQTARPSSFTDKKKEKLVSGLKSFEKTKQSIGAKRKTTTSHRRASLSQCKSASLRLFRRVAEEEHAARAHPEDSTPVVRLSQRAHDHVSFLIRGMEQQLFGQCRKLMRTRTMSPKLLTVSMFMGFDKDLAKEAAKQAFRTRTRMDELDRQFEEETRKLAQPKGG
jgi:hypothetical protein